jgi:hypothetical protein
MLIWADEVLEYSAVNIKRLDRNSDERGMSGRLPSVIELTEGTVFVAPCR